MAYQYDDEYSPDTLALLRKPYAPLAPVGADPQMQPQSMNPLQTGSLVLSGLGTGMGIYGAYKGQQAADENYELAKDNFEAQRERQGIEDERRRRQQELENFYGLSRYSAGMSDRNIGSMQRYNAAVGR